MLLLLLALVFGAPALRAQHFGALPDAPSPVSSLLDQETRIPGKASPHAASSIETAPPAKRKWARYVDPGEIAPRLSRHEKMMFWLHEEVQPWAAAPAFISAGFGQLTNGDPEYGSNSAAFAQRLGAAFFRQASMRFFSNSLIPAMNGEDPRYFRKASGTIRSRIRWSIDRVFVSERDSGRTGFNFSNIFGHLMASALIPLYYPATGRNTETVLETWATAIGGSAGNNAFLEFWPDVGNLWHRYRARHNFRSSRDGYDPSFQQGAESPQGTMDGNGID